MRNTYIQPDENLTSVGRWLAARIPHTDIKWRNAWPADPKSRVFRIFGGKPYCRFAILDYTRAFGGWHLTILGIRVKRNRAFMPGRL